VAGAIALQLNFGHWRNISQSFAIFFVKVNGNLMGSHKGKNDESWMRAREQFSQIFSLNPQALESIGPTMTFIGIVVDLLFCLFLSQFKFIN
jgi:hypothetical protein